MPNSAPTIHNNRQNRVTFLYGDDSKVELSLSARQAGALAVGMRGTLVFRDAVFLSFRPD